MLLCVDGYAVTDVLEDLNAFIIRADESKKAVDTARHFRRFEYSATPLRKPQISRTLGSIKGEKLLD
jgi:hypothetical protein